MEDTTHCSHPRGEQSDQEATWWWGGGVGFGRPAGKKGAHFLPRPRGGTGHSPIWGAQRTRPARHPAWRGPQFGIGDYPTTRPGGGVGIGRSDTHPPTLGLPHWPKRSAKLGVNFFWDCFEEKKAGPTKTEKYKMKNKLLESHTKWQVYSEMNARGEAEVFG